jgi:hypothetical protein
MDSIRSGVKKYLLRLNAATSRFQTVIPDVGAMKDIPWGWMAIR